MTKRRKASGGRVPLIASQLPLITDSLLSARAYDSRKKREARIHESKYRRYDKEGNLIKPLYNSDGSAYGSGVGDWLASAAKAAIEVPTDHTRFLPSGSFGQSNNSNPGLRAFREEARIVSELRNKKKHQPAGNLGMAPKRYFV